MCRHNIRDAVDCIKRLCTFECFSDDKIYIPNILSKNRELLKTILVANRSIARDDSRVVSGRRNFQHICCLPFCKINAKIQKLLIKVMEIKPANYIFLGVL